MPFWMMLLLKMAIKLGLPWVEAHVPPAIAKIIEDILKLLGESKDQKQTMTQITENWNKACSGVGCPVDLVK
jgi:hypothetical protein